MPLFRVLASLKSLRGTPLDIFGYGAERRSERALIHTYESGLDLIAAKLSADNYRLRVALAVAARSGARLRPGEDDSDRPLRARVAEAAAAIAQPRAGNAARGSRRMSAVPGLDFGLGERSTCCATQCARFADDEIAPRAAEIDRSNKFPARPLAGDGRAGPARHHRGGGIRRRRAGLSRALRGDGGDLAAPRPRSGFRYGAHSNLCVNQIRRNGQRGAEAPLSAQADLRRACRRARHVRDAARAPTSSR